MGVTVSILADPFVQAPGDTQSHNRYAYVRNNPMNATDLSGYNWVSDRWHAVKDEVKTTVAVVAIAVLSYYTAGSASQWAIGLYGGCSLTTATVIGGAVGGAAAGFVSGAAYAAYSGANFADVMRGGLRGAATGAVFGGVKGARTAAYAHLLNEELSNTVVGAAKKLRYGRKAKNWRDAEKLEAQRQAKLKGQSVIKGRVGANYDGDNYIGSRLYDVVSVDQAGHWTLTEAKFIGGRKSRFWPFKAMHGATMYSQSEFDYQSTGDLTIIGKNIPGSSLSLSPSEYSIQWVMVNDRGSGTLYSVDIGNEEAMLLNVMRAIRMMKSGGINLL